MPAGPDTCVADLLAGLGVNHRFPRLSRRRTASAARIEGHPSPAQPIPAPPCGAARAGGLLIDNWPQRVVVIGLAALLWMFFWRVSRRAVV
jgi:hypothetical protein